jgi:hypothetical protein
MGVVGKGAIIGLNRSKTMVLQCVPALRDKMWEPINEGGGQILWKTSSRGDGMRMSPLIRQEEQSDGRARKLTLFGALCRSRERNLKE